MPARFVIILCAIFFQALEYACLEFGKRDSSPVLRTDYTELRQELNGLRDSLAADWDFMAHFQPVDSADRHFAETLQRSIQERRIRRDEVRLLLNARHERTDQ